MSYPGITAIRDKVGSIRVGQTKSKPARYQLMENGVIIKAGTVEEVANYIGRGENLIYIAEKRGSTIANRYKVKKG